MSGWAYRIDYAKEIATQEQLIALWCDGGPVDRLEAFWSALPRDPTWDPGWRPLNALAVLQVVWEASNLQGVEALVAITGVPRRNLLAVCWDLSLSSSENTCLTMAQQELLHREFQGLRFFQVQREAQDGTDQLSRIDYMPTQDRQKALRGAKGAVSRYRRNQKKFG